MLQFHLITLLRRWGFASLVWLFLTLTTLPSFLLNWKTLPFMKSWSCFRAHFFLVTRDLLRAKATNRLRACLTCNTNLCNVYLPLNDLYSLAVSVYQVWSLTQFYSVDFSKWRIGVSKCVFNKRTIKVCDSCCWRCPGSFVPSAGFFFNTARRKN